MFCIIFNLTNFRQLIWGSLLLLHYFILRVITVNFVNHQHDKMWICISRILLSRYISRLKYGTNYHVSRRYYTSWGIHAWLVVYTVRKEIMEQSLAAGHLWSWIRWQRIPTQECGYGFWHVCNLYMSNLISN